MTFPPFLLASICSPRIARVASEEELGTMSKNNLRRITLVRGPIWGIHSLTLIISCLHWLPITYRIQFKILLIVFKAFNGLAPLYISELLQPKPVPRYNLR